MKRHSFIPICVVGFFFAVAGCSPASEAVAGDADALTYIRDERPEIPVCYAFYFNSSGTGGPSIATVDCDNVAQLVTKVYGKSMVAK